MSMDAPYDPNPPVYTPPPVTGPPLLDPAPHLCPGGGCLRAAELRTAELHAAGARVGAPAGRVRRAAARQAGAVRR